MKHLNKYLDQMNFARKMFNQPLLVATSLTTADVETITARINSDYSPENLTCDGELSRTEVQARLQLLGGTVRDLESLGFVVELTEV